MRLPIRSLTLSTTLGVCLATAAVAATDAPAPTAPAAAAAPAAEAASAPVIAPTTLSSPPVTLVTVPASSNLTAGQMAAADRVILGDADCDQMQKIQLRAVPGQPGHFELHHEKAVYKLTPEETQTGAVRLEDRAAGMVWLQIPTKSMLLNAKVGQRVVDGCTHPEQRPIVLDARDAWALKQGSAFGIAALGR